MNNLRTDINNLNTSMVTTYDAINKFVMGEVDRLQSEFRHVT
jgi:hypothetical protein